MSSFSFTISNHWCFFSTVLSCRCSTTAFFDALEYPFTTVFITILLIWCYTFRGGIKTIVWTDSLQTIFMLGAVVITIFVLFLSWISTVSVVKVFIKVIYRMFLLDWQSPRNFFKQFLQELQW